MQQFAQICRSWAGPLVKSTLAGCSQLQPSNLFCNRLNDNPEKYGLFAFSPDFVCLASQSALRLRESLGASRRVRRGPSLGDSTSAGAENSQVTLHAATRPTMTAYRYCASREWVFNPDFALLSRNQASLEPRTKAYKIGEGL